MCDGLVDGFLRAPRCAPELERRRLADEGRANELAREREQVSQPGSRSETLLVTTSLRDQRPAYSGA
jgi:hypothetical protein